MAFFPSPDGFVPPKTISHLSHPFADLRGFYRQPEPEVCGVCRRRSDRLDLKWREVVFD